MTAPNVHLAFHVTSIENRASIREHGLNSNFMGAVANIAGSPSPERDGVQLAKSFEDAEWYAAFPTHELVDIWGVDVRGLHLEETNEGWLYRRTIPRERLSLIAASVSAKDAEDKLRDTSAGSGPTGSMSITLRANTPKTNQLEAPGDS